MIAHVPAFSATPMTRPPAPALAVVVRVGGRSVVSRAFAASPLRLLTPRNHGHAAWIFTSTYGGGLLGGDALELHVRVEAGAAAALLTQASTKVYRSPDGASMDLRAEVGDGAWLAVLPDPVVPFAGSTYTQRQEISLAGGGSAVLVDWMTAGRRARGERWLFDRYATRLSVRRDGRLVALESTLLDAADSRVSGRMGRFDVLGTIVLAGPRVARFAAEIVARQAERPMPSRGGQIVSASPLAAGGCLVRIAGTSVESVGRTVRDYLAFLPAMLGDNPWLRKW